MIVAKTRLKRIPKTCKECTLSYVPCFDDRVCSIKQMVCPMEVRPSGNLAYCKPGWCPLVELKEGATNEL